MTVAFVLFAMALAAVVVVKSRADTPLRLSEEADTKSNSPPVPIQEDETTSSTV